VTPPGARADGAVLLYAHGGAYHWNGPRTHAELADRLGRAAGAPVLLPRYRLAPEHPFPAACADVVAVHDALAHAGARVVVGGDSCGGGLAVACAATARTRGVLPPLGVAVLSPWVDLTASSPSVEARAHRDPYCPPELIRACAASYLQGGDPRDPHASPLWADLRGLPPLLVLVGSEETLHDEALALARAARRAGTHVECRVYAGQEHVFPQIDDPSAADDLAVRDAVARFGAFCRARWDGGLPGPGGVGAPPPTSSDRTTDRPPHPSSTGFPRSA
jgi:acetyl esterase/lipase